MTTAGNGHTSGEQPLADDPRQRLEHGPEGGASEAGLLAHSPALDAARAAPMTDPTPLTAEALRKAMPAWFGSVPDWVLFEWARNLATLDAARAAVPDAEGPAAPPEPDEAVGLASAHEAFALIQIGYDKAIREGAAVTDAEGLPRVGQLAAVIAKRDHDLGRCPAALRDCTAYHAEASFEEAEALLAALAATPREAEGHVYSDPARWGERFDAEGLLADVRAMNGRVAALWWQPEDPKADYMDPRSHSQSAQIEMRALLNRVEEALAATPREAAPLDAQDREDAAKWRAAEAEGHIVDFTMTGFGLQHPPSCRPDLIGCRFNVHLSAAGKPAKAPGRYRMSWTSNKPEYARLTEPDA